MKKLLFSFAIGVAGLGQAAQAAPETVKLSILEKPVKVLVDKWGIPHIEAQNEMDLFRAAGYLQAKDRWLQMDFARRNALGTLSELAGSKTLEHDKNMRNSMLWRVADDMIKSSDPRVLAGMKAFSEGANHYLKEKAYKPNKIYVMTVSKARPWEPRDTAAIGAFMGQALSLNYGDDFMVEKVLGKLGEKDGWNMINRMLDHVQSWGALKRKDITNPKLLGTPRKDHRHSQGGPALEQDKGFQSAMKKSMSIGGIYDISPGQYGSNNWVMSGKLTKNGAPIVAGDTHMGLMSPALYWEVHLKAPGIETYGLCFPGSPMPILGFNRHVAWGATVLNSNSADVWKEKLSDDLLSYWFEGKWKPLEAIESPVSVNTFGAQKKEKHIIYLTHRGPLFDVDKEKKTGYSYRWTGNLPIGNLLNGAMGFNLAKTTKDMHEALRHFHTGGQNFVFGDSSGNIGYRSGTKVPLRQKGWRGARVGDGTKSAHDWTGEYIPFEEMPHTDNPKDGFIITANSPVMDRDIGYKHEVNIWAMFPFRIKRGWEMVNNWKKAGRKISIEDHMRMQADVKDNIGAYTLPHLLKILSTAKLTPKEKEAVAVLKAWDFQANLASVGETIFHSWWQRAINELIGPLLGDDYVGHPKNNLLTPALVDLMNEKVKITWGDDTLKKEGAKGRTIRIFKEIVAEAEKVYGPDMKKWTWGQAHQVRFPSLLDEVPGMPKMTVGPFPNNGTGDSLDEAYGHYRDGHKVKFMQEFGPSMRMVVSMEKDGPKGFITNTLGQTMDPADPHFKNQLDDYINNRYHPAMVDEVQIRKHLLKELSLQP